MTSVEAATPGPHDTRKGTAMTVEKQARAASGWPMLFVTLVAYAAAIWGSYTEHCQQSDNFYVYSREHEGERLLVICSFSDKEHYFTAPAGFDLAEGELIFKNYELNVAVGNAFATRPYELRVYRFAADGKGDAQ